MQSDTTQPDTTQPATQPVPMLPYRFQGPIAYHHEGTERAFIVNDWQNPLCEHYTRKHPSRGHRGGRSALQGNTRALRREFPDWTRADHNCAQEYHRRQATYLEIAYRSILDNAAQITFGRSYDVFQDYRIAGIGRDEFPYALKEAIRHILTLRNAHKDAELAHKRTRAMRTSRK